MLLKLLQLEITGKSNGNCTENQVRITRFGLEVSAQGLGCMGMYVVYGPPKQEGDMIDLMHHAIDSGISFLDTSDAYGPFTNEILLGQALKGRVREKVEFRVSSSSVFIDFVAATPAEDEAGTAFTADDNYVNSGNEFVLSRWWWIQAVST